MWINSRHGFTNTKRRKIAKKLNAAGVFSLMGLFGMLSVAGVSVSRAEAVKPAKTIKTEYQYAAKVVCSLLTPHQDGTLARGTYRTKVNIHNPTDKNGHHCGKGGACNPIRLGARPV